MLASLLSRLLGTDPELNEFADRLGAPRAYVTCAHCGAQNWRLPPHTIGEPCPLVQQMSQSVGMKFDAERMLSVRSGVQMEQMTKFFNEHFGSEAEEEDES